LEEVGKYFDQSYPDPFMIKVYNILPDKKSTIPAVTHVDGTGRLQTVDKDNAPLYWGLIDRFKGITGVPVVLNTSLMKTSRLFVHQMKQWTVSCAQRWILWL